MKKFSSEELQMMEEMYLSSAKISATIEFGKMDSEKLSRFRNFFESRYKDYPGCDACINAFLKRYYLRLSQDDNWASVSDGSMTYPKGRDYNECIPFDEIVVIAKSFFKSKDYDKFYADIFDMAHKKTEIKDFNQNPASIVRDVSALIVLNLMCFRYAVNIPSGKMDINKVFEEINYFYNKKWLNSYDMEGREKINFSQVNEIINESLQIMRSSEEKERKEA